MCGVVGVLRLDSRPVDCQVIKSMTDAIAHRGPDGEGQWCEGPIGLGHRRLAIIDLSAEASQPMQSWDSRYVISYNGEVYNFRELRRELEKAGSRFRSNSDTEVVLEAVARWGIDAAIQRFNGMFAFAIWDRLERRLLIGRDRYGIKPLYVWSTPNQIAFASEAKAFRSIPGFAAAPDAYGIAEYFTFQNILSERTFTKDVSVFPAGFWGEVLSTDGVLRRHQYWDFEFAEPEQPGSELEYAEELRRLLEQAVSRQLVSDVEVGSYLSGGLDSGSIVEIASERLPGMKTFTVGFAMDNVPLGEAHFDERLAAEEIASFVGSTQFEVVIGPKHISECLEDLVHHMEEPRVGQSYPNYYAAQLASNFVKVVLSGTGGDECLGGYPWRYPPADLDAENFGAWHFARWQRVFPYQRAVQLSGGSPASGVHPGPRGAYEAVFDGCRGGSSINAALYFEAKTFLPGLLAVEDRLSMAHGLEARVPFLDNDLVDFALNLPRSVRLGDSGGAGQTAQGKRILRSAMLGHLPKATIQAPKQGFSAPDELWFDPEVTVDTYHAIATLLQEHGLPSEESGALEFLRGRDGRRGSVDWSGRVALQHLRDLLVSVSSKESALQGGSLRSRETGALDEG